MIAKQSTTIKKIILSTYFVMVNRERGEDTGGVRGMVHFLHVSASIHLSEFGCENCTNVNKVKTNILKRIF